MYRAQLPIYLELQNIYDRVGTGFDVGIVNKIKKKQTNKHMGTDRRNFWKQYYLLFY